MPDGVVEVGQGSLSFQGISERQAGTYRCTAENGFGQPGQDSVQILVRRE